MDVSRDVVMDLIPVYLSGEASAATVTLVKAWAERDPQIRKLLENVEALPVPAAAHPQSHMEALRMTKRLLMLRSVAMALAILCSLAPFTFVKLRTEEFFMLRDAPESATVYAVLAIVFWTVYGLLRRRVRVTGL